MESKAIPRSAISRWRVPRDFWRLLGVVAAFVVVGLVFGVRVDAAAPTVPGATYIGSDQCKGCHEDQAKKMEHTLHGKLLGTKLSRGDLQPRGCEACHGPGSKHLEDQANPANNLRFGKKSPLAAVDQNAVCLQCHSKGKQILWQGSPHESRDVTCVTCHSVHGPASEKGQLKLVKPDQYDSRGQLLDKVQYDLCGQCHQVRVMQFSRSSHMPLAARGEAGADHMHELPQPARDNDRKVDLGGVHQREMHELPRRKARTVLVGACACSGELPELSPGPWLEPPNSAQGPDAPPLSAMPCHLRA